VGKPDDNGLRAKMKHEKECPLIELLTRNENHVLKFALFLIGIFTISEKDETR
jgi:hypothetical protein